MTQSTAEAQTPSGQDKKKRSERIALSIKLARVIAALGVLVVGLISLWGTWHTAPAAEPFTRVGGETSVETAIDATRFWLSPPSMVVEIPVSASQESMLSAARCAIRNDAPLLVTSSNHARQRLVTATTDYWPRTPVVHFGVNSCPPGNARRPNISFLDVPTQRPLIQLIRSVPPRPELASFVVFAAAFTPARLPDVAVGLALAAHLASTRHAQVSLVFVQPYLEADQTLENQLQNQSGAVTGGVVLGQTPTVPEDTLLLLRRLLTAPDQQGLLDQIKGNLGSLGDFLAVLLGLIAALTVAKAGQPLLEKLPEVFGNREPRSSDVIQTRLIRTDLIETGAIKTGGSKPSEPGPEFKSKSEDRPGRRRKFRMVNIRRMPTPTTPLEQDWRDELPHRPNLNVTWWLRSGSVVTGTFDNSRAGDNKNAGRGDTARLWRLDEPRFLADALIDPGSAPKLAYLLVPVEDIVLVGVNEAAPRSGDDEGTADGKREDQDSE